MARGGFDNNLPSIAAGSAFVKGGGRGGDFYGFARGGLISKASLVLQDFFSFADAGEGSLLSFISDGYFGKITKRWQMRLVTFLD